MYIRDRKSRPGGNREQPAVLAARLQVQEVTHRYEWVVSYRVDSRQSGYHQRAACRHSFSHRAGTSWPVYVCGSVHDAEVNLDSQFRFKSLCPDTYRPGARTLASLGLLQQRYSRHLPPGVVGTGIAASRRRRRRAPIALLPTSPFGRDDATRNTPMFLPSLQTRNSVKPSPTHPFLGPWPHL